MMTKFGSGSIGERIRDRRKDLNLNQEQLAERIGSSQRQVSKYEIGQNDPTADVLARLAEALETTSDYLIGRTDNPDRPLRGMFDLDDIEREAIKVLRSKPREQRQKIVEIMRMV